MTALQDAEKHLADCRAALIPANEAARLSRRALAEAVKGYGGPSRESVVREMLDQSQRDRAAGVRATQPVPGPSHLDRFRARGSNINIGYAGPRAAVGADGRLVRPAQRGAKLPSEK
jgi:hypothetical protein